MHATEIGSSLPVQPPVPASPEPIAEISATLLRAQSFTAANGIALLVREGPALVCRASNGAGALEFGAQVPLDNGFFGLCAGSKKPQKCDDAETDPRIDSATCGRVKPKSILAIPVRDADGAVVAVLGVYSGSAKAFTNTHIAILRTQADSLARPVQQLPKLPPAISTPIPLAAPPPEPVAGADPAAASAAPAVASPTPVSDAPKPAMEPPKPPVPAPPAPVAKPEVAAPPAPAPPAPVSRDIEELLTLAGDPAPAARPREFRAPLPASRAITVPAPRSFTLPRPRRRRRSALVRIAGITALCLLGVLATAGWFAGREPGPPHFKPGSPAVPAIFQAEVAAVQAAKSPATPARPAPVAEVVPEPPATPAAQAHEAKPSVPAVVRQNVPEKVSEATRTSAEPVKKSVPAPDPAPPVVEVEAPRVALNIAPALPAMVAPAARPPAPRRAEIEPARLVQRVSPDYPPAALRRKVGGQVVLSAVIRSDGSVGEVKMVSGNPLFRDSAVTAVRHWRYSPAILDGAPVETSARIVLNFNPPQ